MILWYWWFDGWSIDCVVICLVCCFGFVFVFMVGCVLVVMMECFVGFMYVGMVVVLECFVVCGFGIMWLVGSVCCFDLVLFCCCVGLVFMV